MSSVHPLSQGQDHSDAPSTHASQRARRETDHHCHQAHRAQARGHAIRPPRPNGHGEGTAPTSCLAARAPPASSSTAGARDRRGRRRETAPHITSHGQATGSVDSGRRENEWRWCADRRRSRPRPSGGPGSGTTAGRRSRDRWSASAKDGGAVPTAAPAAPGGSTMRSLRGPRRVRSAISGYPSARPRSGAPERPGCGVRSAHRSRHARTATRKEATALDRIVDGRRAELSEAGDRECKRQDTALGRSVGGGAPGDERAQDAGDRSSDEERGGLKGAPLGAQHGNQEGEPVLRGAAGSRAEKASAADPAPRVLLLVHGGIVW